MKIYTPLIAVFIGLLVFTGIWTFFTTLTREYASEGLSSPTDSVTLTLSNGTVVNVDRAFDNLSASRKDADELRANFNKIGFSVSGLMATGDVMLKVGSYFFKSLSSLFNVFDLTAQLLGIPVEIIVTFLIIIVIVLIIAVYNVIFSGGNT